jgi:hypothetical protein
VTGWQFRVDRGGTLTDIVASRPDGRLLAHKPLSEHFARYADAAVAGVRALLGGSQDPVEALRMGTTVATNAMLERTGEPTLLVVTRGFRDTLRIAYQNRPHSFARGGGPLTDPEALAWRLPGTVLELGRSDAADVGPGDVLVIETPGGGGYGPPPLDTHQAGEEIDDLRAF